MFFAPLLTTFLPFAKFLLDQMSLAAILSPLAYASSAFILLPAGRDIFSPTTPILPGEDKNMPLMTPASPKAKIFMWGVWGLNHCALSALKILAVYRGDKEMLLFTGVTAAITLGYLIKERGSFKEADGDVDGFVAVCTVQTISLLGLALM